MSYLKEWETTFNKAILSFTGRNSPKIAQLDVVSKNSMALLNALKSADKNDPQGLAGEERATTAALFKKDVDSIEKERKKYVSAIDAALKVVDKTTHANAYRDLKILKTSLDKIAADAASICKANLKATTAAADKINSKVAAKTAAIRDKNKAPEGSDEATVNRKEAENSAKIKSDTYLLSSKKVLMIFGTNSKKAITAAAAAVQKIKADPTPGNYKTLMDKAGRDLSQVFSNLIKIRNDPKAAKWDVTKKARALSPFEAELAAFGNGAKRDVAANATPQDVLARAKEFSALVKGVAAQVGPIEAAIKKM